TEKLNAGGILPPADDNTIYTVFFPEPVTLSLDNQKSCKEFGGYHSSTMQNGQAVIFAALPRCPLPMMMVPQMSKLDLVTSATSHELIEASTDPQPKITPTYAFVDDEHFYWKDFFLSEVGDMCAQEPFAFFTPTDVGYMVQRSWSNQAAKAGHDPCVPADPTE